MNVTSHFKDITTILTSGITNFRPYTGKKAKIITVWDSIITSRGQCGSKLGWLSSMTEILCTEKLTFAKSDEQYSSSVEELTTRRLCFLPPMSHDGIQQMSGIFHNKNL